MKQRQHGPMKSPRVCIGEIGIQFRAALTAVLAQSGAQSPPQPYTLAWLVLTALVFDPALLQQPCMYNSFGP
jgi:hypothetical protein